MAKKVIDIKQTSKLRGFKILVYHRIGPEDAPMDGLTVPRGEFFQQMDAICRHYKPMRLGELVRRMRQGDSIDPRSLAVTFDDGYADTYEVARPILMHFHIPATVFVTSGYIDGNSVPFKRVRMLTWKRLRKMASENMEIGSHTVSHSTLSACSLKKAEFEIRHSKKILEEKLRLPVSLFAYPYGHARAFNQEIQNIVRGCGYEAACTTLPGDNILGTDPYQLRRISFGKNQIRRFALELHDFFSGKSVPDLYGTIHGLNRQTRRRWKKRYAWVERALNRNGLFEWSS